MGASSPDNARPTGSFGVDAQKFSAEERQRRDAERAKDRVEQGSPDSMKAKADATAADVEKADRDAKIRSALPKEVDTVFGRVSYEEFKDSYSDVYEQVGEGDLLTIGYVTCEFEFLNKKFRIRTLRDRERTAFTAPLTRSKAEEIGLATQQVFRQQLAVVVQMWSDQDLNESPVRLAPATYDEWLEDASVKLRLQLFEDAAAQVVDAIYAKFLEVQSAVDYASVETFANPWAPRSSSTEQS